MYKRQGQARSIGLIANAATVFPDLLARGLVPDLVTDQTSAHDLLAYFPDDLSFEAGRALRDSDAAEFQRRSLAAMARQCAAMVEFQRRGSIVFDYGNNLRQRALDAGVSDAFSYPGFVPAYVRPLFCEGKGPFRCCLLYTSSAGRSPG